MSKEETIDSIKNNLIRIKDICQESLNEINRNSNPDILLFLNRKNDEISKYSETTKATISAHRNEYKFPLDELKSITDSISKRP